MPQRKPKEHKCSHHTAAAGAAEERSKWRNFHFSGKVIMCSVLFGLGLVLIGGLTLAIAMDESDDEKSSDVNRIENKAPMSVVGPVIMGIGGFTVIVGITMCLFETNICRKGQPDTQPLIAEQAENGAVSNQTSDSSQKRSKNISSKNSSKSSPRSSPIDVHHGLSREFTASDKFLTPPSSFRPGIVNPNLSNHDIQTTLTTSGKSWNTSSDFRTPSSSLQDHSNSFDIKDQITEDRPISPNLEVPTSNTLDPYQHEFVSPKNSYFANGAFLEESSNLNSDKSAEEIHNSQNALNNKDLDTEDRPRSPNVEVPPSNSFDTFQNEFVSPSNSYIGESAYLQESSNLNPDQLHDSKGDEKPADSNKTVESEKKMAAELPNVIITENIQIPSKDSLTDKIDQNDLINNDIEKVDQCLEEIEQSKSNNTPSHFNVTDVTNVDKTSDVTVDNSISDNTRKDNNSDI